VRDEIDELVDWQLRHLHEYSRDGFCQYCSHQRLLNVRGFCPECMNALDAEWDTSEEPSIPDDGTWYEAPSLNGPWMKAKDLNDTGEAA
jgi:predicted amidophosphoribosyltransferase